jgi:hypothetical protein
MSFHDFEQIKKDVPLSKAAQLLGLELTKNDTQMRGACPACKGGGPRALVITEGKGAFCFAAHKGGDVIWLASHIRGGSVKDAAAWLSEGSADTVPSTVPQERDEGKTLAPLSYLEHTHEAVIAIGFDPEVAKRLGIGYANKGLMRGTVAIPVRDEHGVLQGYVGVEDCKLPPDFMTNVVSLDKRRA